MLTITFRVWEQVLSRLAVGMFVDFLWLVWYSRIISTFMTEQTLDARSKVKVLKGGERVIVDNEMTVTRSYMYLYLFLNVGALAGKIGAAFGTQCPFNDTSEATR